MMKRKLLKAMLLCFFVVMTHNLFAQNVVTGTVKDDTGQFLPGVSVVVKGTVTGTITDIDGKFSFSVPNNATLVFSFVGMDTKEVVVGNQRKIDISMIPIAIGMDEVVVTALGISREKKSLAYSVSEVKGAELTKGAGSNVIKSLDGRVSGVNFTQSSSDPAGSVFVTIRGATSLNISNSTMSAQPLFVVDGIPLGTTAVENRNGADFGNLLSQLNPEDIESISVLKGASAGALYGSAAGNGVIMITTNRVRVEKKGLVFLLIHRWYGISLIISLLPSSCMVTEFVLPLFIHRATTGVLDSPISPQQQLMLTIRTRNELRLNFLLLRKKTVCSSLCRPVLHAITT